MTISAPKPAESQPSALLLLLLDSRAPAGANGHSGGMEAAVTAGWVTELAAVEAFCRGKLQTSGRVAAAFAAAACRLVTGTPAPDRMKPDEAEQPDEAGPHAWRELDEELKQALMAAAG